MFEYEEENSRRFWKLWWGTKIIRGHQQMLYTFGDMKLPYIFAAEHPLRDRTIIMEGTISVERPKIIIPGQYEGPEFQEGFTKPVPYDAIHVFRAMGLPHSIITNKLETKNGIAYDSPGSVLKKLEAKLKAEEDTETGLIKGFLKGIEVSLMRYAIELGLKSAPGNVNQFFEHMRLQRMGPIIDNKITDEEARRLFK